MVFGIARGLVCMMRKRIHERHAFGCSYDFTVGLFSVLAQDYVSGVLLKKKCTVLENREIGNSANRLMVRPKFLQSSPSDLPHMIHDTHSFRPVYISFL